MNIQGNLGIGAFLETTEDYSLIPLGMNATTHQKIEKTFGNKILPTSIGGGRLMGVYVVGNSHGCAVPHFTRNSELEFLKSNLKIPVERIPTRLTALGNVILANDYGALVHPGMEKEAIDKLETILKVKIEKGTIADGKLTGSLGTTTNTGTLVDPRVTDEQLQALETLFQTNVDIGTVMRGSPYINLGLVANTHGAVTSTITTGPELARISQTFHYVVER